MDGLLPEDCDKTGSRLDPALRQSRHKTEPCRKNRGFRHACQHPRLAPAIRWRWGAECPPTRKRDDFGAPDVADIVAGFCGGPQVAVSPDFSIVLKYKDIF
ncbi:hypothetical protein [Paenirhodobacter sp.]|uniref:hypothetical protein n=1 Tax=Paenirhodobacter sp. TaxID=1965326 RepID=UPI003B513312